MVHVKQTQKKLQVAPLSGLILAAADDALLYPRDFYSVKDLRNESERIAATVNQPGSV
jgi:hypothetical protein